MAIRYLGAAADPIMAQRQAHVVVVLLETEPAIGESNNPPTRVCY